MDAPLLLREMFAAAVAAAQPAQVLPAHLPAPPAGRTRVLGLGKAAATMGAALEAAWPADAPLSGVLVAPHGTPATGLRRLQLLHGAHPVPDAASVAAAQALLAGASGLGADDLVIVLLSGGASALATLPLPGLTLDDLQAVNAALLASGAPIDEMNTLRKHLCAVKGGRLAAACGSTVPVLTLAISDVPGDALDLIGSGPSVVDPSSCADALAVVQRHGLTLPQAVLQGLHSGAFESVKQLPTQHRSALVASPRLALQAAAAVAQRAGVTPVMLSDALEGEARSVGALLARLALDGACGHARPCVLLSGGETTVTLRSAAPGNGGRAVETLAGALQVARNAEGLFALMADTDGIDGRGPQAGAWFGPDTWARAAHAGLSLPAALAAHDAGGYFQRLGHAFTTGPTGTNVNDFRALLLV
jgi:glycerate 2-kinase